MMETTSRHMNVNNSASMNAEGRINYLASN